MCFNYSLNTSVKSLEARFKAQSVKKHFGPVYHAGAFTFPKMPVITNETTDKINYYNWGLIPNWVKTDTKANEIKKLTLNARSETVFEKPSFKKKDYNFEAYTISKSLGNPKIDSNTIDVLKKYNYENNTLGL